MIRIFLVDLLAKLFVGAYCFIIPLLSNIILWTWLWGELVK